MGAWTYVGLFSLWLVIPFMGVKSWTTLLSFYALLGLGAASAWLGSRHKSGRSSMVMTWSITILVVLAFTRLFGPFVLTPVVACAALMSISSAPPLQNWRLVAWAFVASALPFVLEWLGLVPRSYFVQDGALISVSGIFDMKHAFDEGVVVAIQIASVVAAAIVAIGLSRRRIVMQREMVIRSWHLRQLLPRNWSSRRPTRR
jgi:hypothetical protein